MQIVQAGKRMEPFARFASVPNVAISHRSGHTTTRHVVFVITKRSLTAMFNAFKDFMHLGYVQTLI